MQPVFRVFWAVGNSQSKLLDRLVPFLGGLMLHAVVKMLFAIGKGGSRHRRKHRKNKERGNKNAEVS